MSFSLNGNALECNGQTRQLDAETVLALYRVLTSKLSGRDMSAVSNLKKLTSLFELEFEPDEATPVQNKPAPAAKAPAVAAPVAAKPAPAPAPAKKPVVESDDDKD